MSAREEVACLLVEHAADWDVDGYGLYLAGCKCGWGPPGPDMELRLAEHQAEVLEAAGLLLPSVPEHRHKAFVYFGAPADLQCEICGEKGWSTPSAETQKNWADALADAGRYELERMKRELDEQR